MSEKEENNEKEEINENQIKEGNNENNEKEEKNENQEKEQNNENNENLNQKEDITNDDINYSQEINRNFEIISPESNYDLNFKLIIIGNSAVGKTSITYRATTGVFSEKCAPTIGYEFFNFLVKYKSKIIKLEIWDTCGQEAYRSLIKTFFNNTSLAVIVYAINNRDSFDSIEEWIRTLRNLCSPDIRIFLIGNKNDIKE